MPNETKREIVEGILLDRLVQIRPYAPEMSGVVNRYKDGSFGVSNLAFALYSNGLNPRGRSSKHPHGLIFEDGETIFSIGYYRKELDPKDADGYLIIVAPRGKDIVGKINGVVRAVERDNAPCKGVYVRFLLQDQFQEMLKSGFVSVEKTPWHPLSPQEDETYSHSIVNTDERLLRKTRQTVNRFANFLRRNDFSYSLETLSPDKTKEYAKPLILSHFELLRRTGKAVGSVPEDHYNMLDKNLLDLEDVHAWIGRLNGKPVSVFIGEFLSPFRFGLYTPFTLREAEKIPLTGDRTGFTAMPTYAYIKLFEVLKERGVSEVHLGGSELPSLDSFKRQLGAKTDATHWAFRPIRR